MQAESPQQGEEARSLRRRGPFSRLRRNETGATAVEFAMIAPLFFFLMFVIAETALIFIAEQVMDNAVFDATRLIRTGQAQMGTWPKPAPPACGGSTGYACPASGAVMTKADFKQEICKRVAVFLNCSGLYLDVKTYDSFATMNADAGQPLKPDGTFNTDGYNAGVDNSIVLVRAYYQWPTNPIVSPLLGSLSMSSPGLANKRLIGSFAAFRNEPYDASS